MNRQDLSINGELLPISEIRARAASMRLQREASGRSVSLDERLALLHEARELLIDRTLLLQEARRMQLTSSEAEIDSVLSQWAQRFDGISGCRAGANTPESRKDIRERISVDKVLNQWRGMARRPGFSDLQSYYKANREQFHQAEAIHASHIVRSLEADSELTDLYAQVTALRLQVSNGGNFAQVAREHSDCPENGGDLGWFSRGVMVQEFDDVVFSTPVQTLTPVFQTEFGIHFAVVIGRKPAGIPPFDQVRPAIEQSLWLTEQDKAVERELAALRAKADITGEI